jgi:methionyl-tRNA synthetase
MTKKRRILITPALPYANGPIHLGHVVEHTMADTMARFFRMMGHECLLLCADDTHGTPIMLSASRKGIDPSELVEQCRRDHLKELESFGFAYDRYASTNSEATKQLASEFFLKLEENGHVETKKIEQSYCEHDKMFLPDRFVKGTCPKCNATDQYGDGCEKCGTVYQPEDLKDSYCSICSNPPVKKASEHIFVRINDFKSYLNDWVSEHTSTEVKNKLDEWLKNDLQSWCISRDEPYFGFEIPGHPKKYFYVWFDAPIGYIGALKEWCDDNGQSVKDYWNHQDQEIFHIIGKDIMYHHTLFWPAMLKASGYKAPSKVFVHGMLNVEGAKMSKSRGTAIDVSSYLKHLDPTYLRYYLACKLNASTADMDFSPEDFVARVNSDLIGKITNLASRGATMLHKIDGKLGKVDQAGQALLDKARAAGDKIAAHYEASDFAKAMVAIRDIADACNRYFDEAQPWKIIKDDPESVRAILTTTLNVFRIISIYLKPAIPDFTKSVEAFFEQEPYSWQDSKQSIESRAIQPYQHLLKRVDQKQLEKILEESGFGQKEKPDTKIKKTKEQSEKPTKKSEITIDEFDKVELKVAKIITAEFVEGAKKLLKLTVDIGGETKTVFSGIRSAYEPKDLIGKHTILVANLKPRKMKFGVSEGMILAAGDNESLSIFVADRDVKPGDTIS